MFMPGRNIQQELAEKQAHYRRIEAMAEQLIPDEFRKACSISIQEKACGDPSCAPIDTVITLLFDSGAQGMFGIPAEAKDVDQDELEHCFPTEDVLEKWFKGEDAEWPPVDVVELRFDVGTRVICRVGPTGWLPGQIVQLWYREAQWPEGALAPYQIRLDDGREIFAPVDIDQVIQLDPNASQDAKVVESADGSSNSIQGAPPQQPQHHAWQQPRAGA